MNTIIRFGVFACICIPIFSDGIYHSDDFQIISLLIAAICSYTLFIKKNEAFSLYKIFIIYVIFFFCVAPIIQFKNNVRFFDSYFLDSDYIETSIYALFIIILVSVLYFIFRKKLNSSFCKIPNNRDEYLSIHTNKEIILITIASLISIYYLYLNNFNFMSLMFRGGEMTERVSQSQITLLIMDKFIRPMPMIIFLSAYILGVKHKIVLPILFILMIISAPPTGMARFSTATMYIPVILCLFPFFRKGYVFILSMVIGLLVVFPFLDNFRNFSSDSSIKIGFNFGQFEELHFDSHSMFMRVLTEDIVTYGKQLLGAIFFFVPRSIWPSKPIGSGHTLLESMGSDFTNVCMPYFGEGYINFGHIGVIVFITILAYIMAKLDIAYWTQSNRNGLEQIRYYMLLALLMFILRGDLMSSFAYTCGFIASFYIVKWLLFSKK